MKQDEAGTKRWYKGDTRILHRLDGPAVERADGSKHWYKNGELHRLDGPAIEFADGGKQWWENDKRHRLDGPAVEQANGTKHWWVNGERHRSDGGPAIEFAAGGKYWFENGERHRSDGGPAVEYASGRKEWWVNDNYLDGKILDLFKQAIDKTTPSSKVGELSHHESSVVAEAAAHNPNCPIEAQVEWTLTRGAGE